MRYTVIRDTREQDGWDFPESQYCAGTVVATMKTGDYTLSGFENELCIERKGAISEFAKNIIEERFELELIRLEEFKFPFMVLEFDMNDILLFPKTSTIPKSQWSRVKMSPFFILKKLIEYQVNYKCKIILAGRGNGRTIAGSIFKRVIENYERKNESVSGTSKRNNRTRVAKS